MPRCSQATKGTGTLWKLTDGEFFPAPAFSNSQYLTTVLRLHFVED
jgi:hypothetical protein